MTRRRFIQSKEPPYELIEITADYEPERRGEARERGVLWNDREYDGMRATDGTDISSRTKHREYMKRTGLTTTDDFKETWAKAQQQRADYFARGGSVTRSDIERAFHQALKK